MSESQSTPITWLLQAHAEGDPAAASALFRGVYAELRRMAGAAMRDERHPDLLQPTALVNEAFLRIWNEGVRWDNRRHFFAAAARSMRQVLVDNARRRHADKRGSGAQAVTLALLENQPAEPGIDLVELGQLVEQLESTQPRLARLIELRTFAGLDIEACADLLDVSPATIKRDWTFARAWLLDRLGGAA